MNPVFKKIFWTDLRQRKTIPPSLTCASFTAHEPEFIAHQCKELHRLELSFRMDSWLDADQSSKQIIKDEIARTFINQLQSEFYGEIEHLIHELRLHVLREEYQDCLKTIKLLDAAINGNEP